ncbi:hypothetical protein CA85_50940 [Allorhodopirellula solitaria]|uniref:Uncharacterized protein n=1 Tax=Allorhodopirellula solitaria TaxID=2527987 RepID=A0A5C5WMR7_9BACT|nr:hypothetical protein CA85_50940 [Allorhodopirellula solitaria]
MLTKQVQHRRPENGMIRRHSVGYRHLTGVGTTAALSNPFTLASLRKRLILEPASRCAYSVFRGFLSSPFRPESEGLDIAIYGYAIHGIG